MSRIKEVDLTFLILFSHFYFLFNLSPFILFLRTRIRETRSYCHPADHKPHDVWKDVEPSRRSDIIQRVIYMVI